MYALFLNKYFCASTTKQIDTMFTESGDTIRKETVIERTFTSSISANSTSKSASAATANSDIHSGSSSGPNSSSLSNFDYFGESMSVYLNSNHLYLYTFGIRVYHHHGLVVVSHGEDNCLYIHTPPSSSPVCNSRIGFSLTVCNK